MSFSFFTEHVTVVTLVVNLEQWLSQTTCSLNSLNTPTLANHKYIDTMVWKYIKQSLWVCKSNRNSYRLQKTILKLRIEIYRAGSRDLDLTDKNYIYWSNDPSVATDACVGILVCSCMLQKAHTLCLVVASGTIYIGSWFPSKRHHRPSVSKTINSTALWKHVPSYSMQQVLDAQNQVRMWLILMFVLFIGFKSVTYSSDK